jgi:ketosteroid isomerase-like protein
LAKNNFAWIGLLLFSFFLGLFLISSCHKKTEEDAILELVDTLARLAEKKDLEGIMTYFADDFLDFEGRDKAGIKALLAGHFSGRTGIVVHPLSSRIDSLVMSKASLQTEVALSSGGAEALRRLVRISPDNYRIKIGLVKDGAGWFIQSAEWSYISLDELFPESLAILKKIFPKL